MPGIRPNTIRAVLTGAALALLGCGAASAQQPARFAPLGTPKTVKVGTVNQISDAGLFVAIEKGYFKELGLDVDLVTFQSATNMIAPLGAGQLDVAGGATTAGLWNAELRRIGIKAVADKGSSRAGFGFLGLIVKPDSPIKGCADAKGKRVTSPSASNSITVSIEAWLGKCGLSLKDIDLKTMPYPEVPAAIINGAADIGHLGEPLITLNERKGSIRIIARQNDMREHEQIAELLYSEQMIKNTDIANRFMVAYVRGIRAYLEAYAKRPPADWLIDVFVKHTPVKDRALLGAIIPSGLDEWGRMDIESMKQDFAWFKKQKLIVSDQAKFEDGLDLSFVNFAKSYIEAYYK